MPRISELKDINFDGIDKSLYTSRKSKDFKEVSSIKSLTQTLIL